ncbi:MAG: FtsX-like permease family protein [Clostridiaceae bacterium]|jgi:putative ABC transport system permease protein|nr:FtsX-like permease family protein [Clostridiaceae bacterium]
MIWAELFKQAFDSLKANKVRSLLTMLGIVMGVFSVIAIMALGNATENYIASEFEKIGANTYNIYNKTVSVSSDEYLKMSDIDLLVDNIPEIKNITTLVQGYGELRIDKETRNALIYGVTSQYRNFTVIDFEAGRFINNFDDRAKSKVMIVDETFAKRYFNSVDIIGEEVNLKVNRYNVKVKIVGVLSLGDDFLSSLSGDQIPAIVYMPASTLQSLTNNERLDTIMFSLKPDVDMERATKNITGLLNRSRHKDDLYYVQSMQDVQEMVNSILSVITSVLLAVAVITLVVGGIGIINILLVSVTERIREIGIRKALGAQRKNIVFQFLMESIIMTVTAGIIGILLGVLVGNVISKAIGIPPSVDIATVVGSFTMSVILGLVFGVYPAKKAADLDPIEALRYE